MDKRKFLKAEEIYQRINRKGNVFAYELKGENETSVFYNISMQGKARYDGDRWNQIIYSINFADVGLNWTSKVKDTFPDEADYCDYAIFAVMEEWFEEYYKVALLITKNRLINSISGFEKITREHEITGHWPWDMVGDVKLYQQSNSANKKALKTLDITESDLKFFK